MTDISVITRKFDRGATDATFNQASFDTGFVPATQSILASNRVHQIIVVTCGGGDAGKFAENIVDGETPTTRAVKRAFPSETKSGRVKTVVSMNWGLNAGSAGAVNDGLALAEASGTEYVLCWSSELKLGTDHIALALNHMESHALDVCGIARSGFWLRPQWQVPQNTGAVWRMSSLSQVYWFSTLCDGDGKTTISTKDYGGVPLAGMDDFECILRMHKHNVLMPRLGMVSCSRPVLWDLALKMPGTAEYDDNLKKIARQWEVMKAYAKIHFPDEPFEGVYMRIMGRMRFD